MDDITKLQKIFDECKNIVFFGGAGVSTASGIPDFRSQDGLYNQKYDYPPETILSNTFFRYKTKEFFKFYNDKILCCLSAKPNFTHYFLAKAEEKGVLRSVITQNIDGLHQKAGSKKVRELHGSVLRNYCTVCNKFYEADFVKDKYPPKCVSCGGIIKPSVVLYEESLPQKTMQKTAEDVENADALIVGGTSLTVSPACYYVQGYKKKNLVIINSQTTPEDGRADLVFHEKLNDVLQKIKL